MNLEINDLLSTKDERLLQGRNGFYGRIFASDDEFYYRPK